MKYTNLKELRKQVPDNDYNRWAIDMLEMIAKKEGWEESETHYFLDFFEDIL